MTTLTMGVFTVQVRLRPDNPAFPVYVIFRGERLVGRSFSMPDEGCCHWLEAQEANRIRYAEEAAQKKFCMRDWSIGRRGRPTKAEQERRAALAHFEEAE